MRRPPPLFFPRELARSDHAPRNPPSLKRLQTLLHASGNCPTDGRDSTGNTFHIRTNCPIFRQSCHDGRTIIPPTLGATGKRYRREEARSQPRPARLGGTRPMNFRTSIRVAVALVVAGVGVTASAGAQTLSNIGNINLNATAAQTLTVAVTSGSTVNFVLAQGAAAAGDVSPAISTSWNLNPGLTGAVSLFGYFNTPSQALTDGVYDIASTYVQGRMTTGSVA